MFKYYAGIGSRNAPEPILHLMKKFAELADVDGWILRSGAAVGADSAFESGTTAKEIFLPWKGFNNHPSTLCPPSDEAFRLAAGIHPIFKRLRPIQQALIARNMHQILGQDLKTPVEFVVCWTPDGCESYKTYSEKTGGTGSAIALASKLSIPIFNFYNDSSYQYAAEFITGYSYGEQEW